jgi:hypothetical protein
VDAGEADAPPMSTIWHEGRVVGEATSGGWGYRVGASIALAMLRADLAPRERHWRSRSTATAARPWYRATGRSGTRQRKAEGVMAKVVLLDGGMGQELVHRAGDRPTPLWSTTVMMEHPGLVRAVHDDYFAAGATVATTNTYAIHRDRLEGTGFEDRFAALHAQALSEATAARDAAGHGRIAGSIGPLVASYRPEVHPPHAEAVAKYAEVAREIGPQVDLILCETVSSLAHARAVLEGAKAAGKPVWIASRSTTRTDRACARASRWPRPPHSPATEAPRRSSPTAPRPRRCPRRSRP